MNTGNKNQKEPGGGDLTILSYLERARFEFEVSARGAVENILGAPTRVAKRFRVSLSLDNDATTTCFIPSLNGNYRVSFFLETNLSDFSGLFPKKVEAELGMDAIGEIANIVAGNVIGSPDFAHQFGPMAPSLPRFHNGLIATEDCWCLQGTLGVNYARLFFGLVIKEIGKEGAAHA